MDKKDLEKLQNISKNFKKLNAKIKLIALLEKAKAEFEKNQYENCSKTCKEVLKNSPNKPTALRGLGCSMLALKNYEKALEYYKKALKFSTQKEIEYTLIGTTFYLQENL